jgi:hypothetical protein
MWMYSCLRTCGGGSIKYPGVRVTVHGFPFPFQNSFTRCHSRPSYSLTPRRSTLLETDSLPLQSTCSYEQHLPWCHNLPNRRRKLRILHHKRRHERRHSRPRGGCRGRVGRRSWECVCHCEHTGWRRGVKKSVEGSFKMDTQQEGLVYRCMPSMV